jgi:hypothetical protein
VHHHSITLFPTQLDRGHGPYLPQGVSMKTQLHNLRELTKQQHTRAEKSAFINRMLKKTMTPAQYYVYLSNMLLIYSLLEDLATSAGILEGIEDIKRTANILHDIQELEQQYGYQTPSPLLSTLVYTEYLLGIEADKDKLLAHIYVHHMGDLSGGQILKRFVFGSGTRYEFNNGNLLKQKLHERLHDGLETEAKYCFDMITTLMEDLEESVYDLGTTD